MKTVHNKVESYHVETVSCTMNPEINTTVATKDLCLTWFSSGSRHFLAVARVLESFAAWTRLVASFAFFFEKYLKRIMNTRFEVIFILSIIGSLDYWPERRCDPRDMRIRYLPPQSMKHRDRFSIHGISIVARDNCRTKSVSQKILISLYVSGVNPYSSYWHQWHDMYEQQVYLLYLRSSVCNCGNHLSYYIPSYIIFSLSLLQILIIQMYLSCHVCVISAMDCSDQSYPRNDLQISYFSQNCVSCFHSGVKRY